jgi:hypothetical protein
MITLVYVGFVCFVMGKCRSSLLTAKFRTWIGRKKQTMIEDQT